jgi:hypothetical protein
MSKYTVDFTATNKAIQDQVDAAEAAAGVPSTGISSDQEAKDIAAAVKPMQDKIDALTVDDQAKADLAASLQSTIDKIKAALA